MRKLALLLPLAVVVLGGIGCAKSAETEVAGGTTGATTTPPPGKGAPQTMVPMAGPGAGNNQVGSKTTG